MARCKYKHRLQLGLDRAACGRGKRSQKRELMVLRVEMNDGRNIRAKRNDGGHFWEQYDLTLFDVNCLHHQPRVCSLRDSKGKKTEPMALEWGITWNKGKCYDFWMDFYECTSCCKEPKDCSLLREDYLILECLHHSKEIQST